MWRPLEVWRCLAPCDQYVTRLGVADVARLPLGVLPVGILANPATLLGVHAMAYAKISSTGADGSTPVKR